MNTPTKHQVIEENGRPLFVLVPYQEYLRLTDEDGDISIPLAVSMAANLEDKSLVRAWREHKGLSQAEVAGRMGISRPAYARMEEKRENLRGTTISRLAAALGVSREQLRDWQS
jgi:DNA-binding XRE family transcriptional regulator